MQPIRDINVSRSALAKPNADVILGVFDLKFLEATSRNGKAICGTLMVSEGSLPIQ